MDSSTKASGDREVIEVAAAVIFREGKLLIARRPAGVHLEGLWEFPGGKRLPDESFEACLARELLEELGVQAQVGESVASLVYRYPERTVRLEFFRCELGGGEPKTIGCSALAWVTAGALGEFKFPPADAPLVERLRQTPELWR